MILVIFSAQPPSGGCVLKQASGLADETLQDVQPPSGGCVLKQYIHRNERRQGSSHLRVAVC